MPTRITNVAIVACAAAALATAGCAPELGGRASFPLISRNAPPGYETVIKVNEKRCMHNALILFTWGDDANHEALVSDVLRRHNGDAISHASLTFHEIPALLYNRVCARVEGIVVRRPATETPPSSATATPASGAATSEGKR